VSRNNNILLLFSIFPAIQNQLIFCWLILMELIYPLDAFGDKGQKRYCTLLSFCCYISVKSYCIPSSYFNYLPFSTQSFEIVCFRTFLALQRHQLKTRDSTSICRKDKWSPFTYERISRRN
jgi:hypothetical protein